MTTNKLPRWETDDYIWRKRSRRIPDLPGEEWRYIKDFPYYKVSNKGRVKSVMREIALADGNTRLLPEKLMSYEVVRKGYYRVTLYRNGKRTKCFVHRLVTDAFIPNPLNLPCVNHKDEDKTDNCVENLEWITWADNIKYSFERRRERNENAKRTAKNI